jgi:hypothetical protein
MWSCRKNTASSETKKQDDCGSFTAAQNRASIPMLETPYRVNYLAGARTNAGMIAGLAEVAAEVDRMREQMTSVENDVHRSGSTWRIIASAISL